MAQRTFEAGPATRTESKAGTSIRRVGSRGARRRWSSRIYLPALVIPGVALLLVGVGWSTHWGGMDFAASLTSVRAVTIGPLAVALIAVFLVAERLRPAQQRALVARGHRQDVLYAVL